MSELRDLYQEVILDHTKHPRNKGKLLQANRHAEGFNPLCGDKVIVYLSLDKDKIKEVSFEGSGCAISTASISMLTEHLKGKTINEVNQIFKKFHDLVTGKKEYPTEADLGKLIIFEGVREFPTRIKCATLGWHTLLAAIKNEPKTISTEEEA